jgi:hypothetical protein
MTAERQVRVTSYRKSDGTQVRAYTQKRDSADEAKEKWDTRKWQAASAGASLVVALAGAITTLLGITSEIVFAILLLVLLGLNYAVKAITDPKPKTVRRTKRRMNGATARRRTAQARRRR